MLPDENERNAVRSVLGYNESQLPDDQWLITLEDSFEWKNNGDSDYNDGYVIVDFEIEQVALDLDIVRDSLDRSIDDANEVWPGGLIAEGDLVELEISEFFHPEENEAGELFGGGVTLSYDEFQFNIYRSADRTDLVSPTNKAEDGTVIGPGGTDFEEGDVVYVELAYGYIHAPFQITADFTPENLDLSGIADDPERYGPKSTPDTVTLTPVTVDVDIDIAKDSVGATISDELEENPGGIIVEGNLVQLTVHRLDTTGVLFEHGIESSIELSFDSSKIRIWESIAKENEIFDGDELAGDEDHDLFVELREGVAFLSEIEIAGFSFVDGSDSLSQEFDVVKLTVSSLLDLDITKDANGASIPDSLEETPGGENWKNSRASNSR